MRWRVRSLVLLARLAWPHVLAPWRSPLVRWRMETYGVTDDQGRLLTAASIDRKAFMRFAFARRAALGRFLRWAASFPS